MIEIFIFNRDLYFYIFTFCLFFEKAQLSTLYSQQFYLDSVSPIISKSILFL